MLSLPKASPDPINITSILSLPRNATVGFEASASEIEKPSKSLHRMLSAKGIPIMHNLTTIFAVLRQKLNVNIEVHAVPLH